MLSPNIQPTNPEVSLVSDRSTAFQSRQHQRRIRAQAHQLGAVDFFNVLTGAQLLEQTGRCCRSIVSGSTHRR